MINCWFGQLEGMWHLPVGRIREIGTTLDQGFPSSVHCEPRRSCQSAAHGLPGAGPQRGHSGSPALLPTLASPTLHLQLLQGPIPVVLLLTCYRKHFPCFLQVECDMGSDLLFCEQIIFLYDCRVRNQDMCSAPGCTKRAALQGPSCWGLSDTCIWWKAEFRPAKQFVCNLLSKGVSRDEVQNPKWYPFSSW